MDDKKKFKTLLKEFSKLTKNLKNPQKIKKAKEMKKTIDKQFDELMKKAEKFMEDNKETKSK